MTPAPVCPIPCYAAVDHASPCQDVYLVHYELIVVFGHKLGWISFRNSEHDYCTVYELVFVVWDVRGYRLPPPDSKQFASHVLTDGICICIVLR